MKIFVGTETGYKIELDVEYSDTIDNIKSKIMHKTKLQYERIELFLSFRTLTNNRTLADYNISQGQTITLVIGPKWIDETDIKKKRKKYYNKEMLIEERKNFHEYLKSHDLQTKNVEFKKLTGQNFDMHDLEMAQPHNVAKYEERKEDIKEIQKKLLNENIQTNEDYINNVTEFGQKMKENIIYETFNHPEKFIKLEEIKDPKEGSVELIEGALATMLSNNGITYAIEKETSDEESSKLSLQLICSGEAFRQNLKISYSYGEEKDAEILSNEEEKAKFINEKKKVYSSILNVPEDDIIISNLEYGSINFWVKIKDQNLTDQQKNDLIKKEEEKGEKIDAQLGCLLCACKITSSMFDTRGNRNSGWGKGEKRGPPNHLIDYDPPEGWFGYGLKVMGQYGNDTWLGYSNVEGEWYIAYHGTSGSVGQSILDKGFKAGDGQVHQGYDNINELSKKLYPKVGRGVYCSPLISTAQGYSSTINFLGQNYYFVFMCRVNPNYVRMSSNINDYWVVSGDDLKDPNGKKYDDQIRPYRILLKKC